MADPNMEMIRQLREAMEDEGFTPTTTNGWIGTVADVARLARDHARLTAALRMMVDRCEGQDALAGSPLAAARAALSAEAGDTDDLTPPVLPPPGTSWRTDG